MQVSGIVLAGGASMRLGKNKALAPVGGEPIMSRVIGRLSKVIGQSVVVVGDSRQAAELPLPDSTTVATDLYRGGGALGGIFTGLSAAEGVWGLVVACDLPFLNPDLLMSLLELRDDHDAVVPVVNGRPEPVHAAYSKACIPKIETRLKANNLKIARFLDDVRVRYMSQEEIERLDPDHLSFFNVNTKEDLDRAHDLAVTGA